MGRAFNPVVSRNTITTECVELQAVGRNSIGVVSGVPCVSGPSNFAGEREEADGGCAGWLDQPTAGGRDRLLAGRVAGIGYKGEGNCRERLGGLLRYHYRAVA